MSHFLVVEVDPPILKLTIWQLSEASRTTEVGWIEQLEKEITILLSLQFYSFFWRIEIRLVQSLKHEEVDLQMQHLIKIGYYRRRAIITHSWLQTALEY